MALATNLLGKLNLRNNLRFQFVVSFVLYALLVVGIFVVVLHSFERTFASEFFNRRISSELQYFEYKYERDSKTPLPVAGDIRSYLGTTKMPDYIKNVVENQNDGIYYLEIDDDKFFDQAKTGSRQGKKIRNSDDIYFGIKTLSDDQKVYIFIDFEYWNQKEHDLRAHYSWSYFVAFLVAILLGIITANRVIKPLKRLMELVKKSDPDNIPSGFSQLFKNDEFGALAKAFENSLGRVKKFIKRENQFTRDASHELRTPVTVIKGAVELLKMTPACEEKMVEKLVKRIERSTIDMETTIESLLWLARESDSSKAGVPVDLLPIVQRAMDQNQQLIAGKSVEMLLIADEIPTVSAPAGVLTIAISNLIRNACQFTVQGEITITLKANRIEVSDTGVGIKKDNFGDITKPEVTGAGSNGFGFGLDIVNRLCTRFDWQLKIESQADQGTKTQLIFN
jgi:signal transduction histidine kinase